GAHHTIAKHLNKGIIACGEEEHLQHLQTKKAIIYNGFGEVNEFQALNLQETDDVTIFDVHVRNNYFDKFTIEHFGNHNVLNALAVIAYCHYEGMESKGMKALSTFGGVKRRFTEKTHGHQVLIDDYAHHPIEVAATIDSAQKKYSDREVVAIFQPHTFSRTKVFLDEFAESLKVADYIYLCDIFSSARESDGDFAIEHLQNKIPGAKLLTV